MSTLIFKIFVAGLNSRNRELITAFKNTCTNQLKKHRFEVEVIDVTKQAGLAESDKVLATPTILRYKPLPEKRAIGDFRREDRAEQALEFLTEDLKIRF